MQKFLIIAILIFLDFSIKAQVVFKTIAPPKVVMTGESFPIQFVLEDVEKSEDFTPPVFAGLKLVSGPYTYDGLASGVDRSIPVKNIVYTLVAARAGKYYIKGASVKVNGRYINSDDIVIEVISKAQALQKALREGKNEVSDYFLRPDENPYEKINKNLFMKVTVNKRDCYIGEPVVATFKLYSRLNSSSDIVKNPGFYGFAVQDVVSLNDRVTVNETINGKAFDVHIVRTVQLYPLQAGVLTIDPMEVMNKIEFSKSAVTTKAEQEITEGVVPTDDAPVKENTVVYENSFSTEKIAIRVKPYPVKNKPPTFNGATGKFSIHAEWGKNDLAKNEEGILLVTIKGKGNFTQLPSPLIQWPAGIEAFEPVIKDSLDKTQTPLKGSRTFRFPFIAAKAGTYTIPAISFSFFDPDSNHYRSVSTTAPELKINNRVKEAAPTIEKTNSEHKKKSLLVWWISGAVLVIAAILLIYFFRKRNKNINTEISLPEKTTPAVSVHELLQPAQFALKAEDRRFYDLLQKSIWDYLSVPLKLSGSKISKPALYKAMHENHFTEENCQTIIDILQQCEAAAFTQAELNDDKQDLLDRAKRVLEQVRC